MDRAPSRSFGQWLATMPRWKKLAVGGAVLALVAGGVLSLVATGGEATVGPQGSGSGLATGLVPGGANQPGSGGAAAPAAEPAAKGVFRLGFSFLAGFCLGSFLRATLKIASIAFGFWLAMTMVLAYYGLVVVDWNAIDGLWNRFTGSVEQEWGDFQRFVTGSLPAAGLVVLGFAAGIKRH